MRQYKLTAALLAAAILAGCGGSDNDNDDARYAALVSFGDSYSDVGTYAVGTVKGVGGGKYTINSATSKNLVEHLADKLDVAAPCAVQTGLAGSAAQGLLVEVVNHPGCTGYAQGGARITNPVGPGNKALGGANAVLGQLTMPIVAQIQTHLANNGDTFSGKEMVFVTGGGNDALLNLAAVSGGAATPTQAVTAMGVAGAELAGYVKNLIVAKGAKFVTVVNLADLSQTPFGKAQTAQVQGLINTMVTTFNAQLAAGLAGTDVLLVDGYTASRDLIANPASHGIGNATSPACDLRPAVNLVGNSLTCSTQNLVAGVTGDDYLFADSLHLTPFGYKLYADAVEVQLKTKGWL